jgi:hypothetical protein
MGEKCSEGQAEHQFRHNESSHKAELSLLATNGTFHGVYPAIAGD